MKRIPGFRSIADYLSLGYLYLLLLGVASDSISYGLLGINIISYSTVLDVLLSPITHLTGSLIFPAFVVLIPLGVYGMLRLQLWWVNRRLPPAERTGQLPFLGRPRPLSSIWLGLSAWVILAGFIGFGIGGGTSLKRQISAGDFKVNRLITFQDNQSVPVKWIGNNSAYAFYVRAGEKAVTVSPILNNIRAITKFTGESEPVVAPAAEAENPDT
jgi:hypothetical protein